MMAITNRELQETYPHLFNGAHLSVKSDNYFAVSLYGPGDTHEDKIAFVCQYADACGQKVLLLDECGVLFPKHKTKNSQAWRQAGRFIQKVGLIDVLRAASVGEQADCYAAAWCRIPELAKLGYERVFIAADNTVNVWGAGAVAFLGRNKHHSARLGQKLYDLNVVVLGIVDHENR